MSFAARNAPFPAVAPTRSTVTYVISANTVNAAIILGTTSPTTGSYIAGGTDVSVVVNSGIYAYSNATGTAGLSISGGVAGDKLMITNNGYILGCGGNGGAYTNGMVGNGGAGGTGLSITGTYAATSTITNAATRYICGGGGGGGAAGDTTSVYSFGAGGGGGAGSGVGGSSDGVVFNSGTQSRPGGSGGILGAAGLNGFASYDTANTIATETAFGGGGGGARPTNATGGVSGTASGNPVVLTAAGGGGAGGGGAGFLTGTISPPYYKSGGGGGFGAAGGTGGINGAADTTSTGGADNNTGGAGLSGQTTGGAGGAAIRKNGNTITVTNSGAIWGSQLA